MATRVVRDPSGREIVVREEGEPGRRKGMPFRISWGALFAGAFAALGVWILLYALGVALGLSTVNPNDPGSVRGSGIFTGAWGLITPLIALFIGGLVAARSSGPNARVGGGMHGLVVWSLTAVGGVWLIANLFGGAISTAATMSETAATAAEALGEGQAGRAGTPVEGLAGRVQQALPGVDEAGQGALEAAPETGAVFWIIFGALLLGLAAAVLGGIAGVSLEQRRLVAEAGVYPELSAAAALAPAAVAPGAAAPAAVAPPVTTAGREVDELRNELAELRSEVRAVLVRTEDLRH
jgi:hypothetical protein